MDEELLRRVRRRAADTCEYWRLPAGIHPIPFEIEHVIPRQHGGATVLSNLALACLHCNRHKGPNLSGLDRHMGRAKLVPLSNPRRHRWGYHFRWEGAVLIGRTAIGRATVNLLCINDPLRLGLRESLIKERLFPQGLKA